MKTMDHMEKGQITLGLFAPPSQEATKAVQARMRPFHDEASRFSVRQSIVNRFILRERCSCVPFPYKSWLVKGCSCSCDNLFDCFALGWWEGCLCLLAQGRCCCTQARGLRVVSFRTGGGGKALQAPGRVGDAVKYPEEPEAFLVVCFRQSIVLLLVRQVTE